MRRRDFLTLAGATAALLPLPMVALAAQPSTIRRRVAILWNSPKNTGTDEREGLLRAALQRKGWNDANSLQIEDHFDATNTGNPALWNAYVDEMTRFPPEVIVGVGVTAVSQAAAFTRAIPIVQWGGTDPVSLGVVGSASHPEGNITAAVAQWWDLAGKFVDLLIDLVPAVKNVGYFRDPRVLPSTSPYFDVAHAAGIRRGIDVADVGATTVAEIEATTAAVATKANPGLILQQDTFLQSNRPAFIAAMAKYKVPAISGNEQFSADGGLASYAANIGEVAVNTASLTDALLRGARVRDLPILYPTKLDLSLNLKAAKAIGLTVPASVIARADALIV